MTAVTVVTAFFMPKKEKQLKTNKLKLYHVDIKYIRDLARVDDNVMSISPQVGKANRPFLGIVVICDEKKYCIPLTSPKVKHEKMKNDVDFSKMLDKKGKILGALNFNNMIPVNDSVLKPIDMKFNEKDTDKDRVYKDLLNNQLNWCNDNREAIDRKANKLYKLITEQNDKMKFLAKRCCDFAKLETVLEKWDKK